MGNKVNLVYATDDGYLTPTLVAAASALCLSSDRKRLVVHVLDVGVSENRWLFLEDSLNRAFGFDVNLIRHRIEEKRLQGVRRWHGSTAAYARLLIPELMPDVDWCVYADGDTLFTDDPLKLEGVYDPSKAIQGHSDWLPPQKEAERKQWYEDNGYIWSRAKYFCSGFILMNLGWFRRNNAGEKCLAVMRRHADILCPDQDALAIVCRGAVGILPEQWGIFSHDVCEGLWPGCIHYAANLPWNFFQNRLLGYADIKLVWVYTAKALLGLEPWEIGCKSRLNWFWIRFQAALSQLLFSIPPLRRKYPWVRDRFLPRKFLKALCPSVRS